MLSSTMSDAHAPLSVRVMRSMFVPAPNTSGAPPAMQDPPSYAMGMPVP